MRDKEEERIKRSKQIEKDKQGKGEGQKEIKGKDKIEEQMKGKKDIWKGERQTKNIN